MVNGVSYWKGKISLDDGEHYRNHTVVPLKLRCGKRFLLGMVMLIVRDDFNRRIVAVIVLPMPSIGNVSSMIFL